MSKNWIEIYKENRNGWLDFYDYLMTMDELPASIKVAIGTHMVEIINLANKKEEV